MSEFRDQSFTGALLKALRFGNKVHDLRYSDTVFPDTLLGDFPDTSAGMLTSANDEMLQRPDGTPQVRPQAGK
jgi:hypothetical protein